MEQDPDSSPPVAQANDAFFKAVYGDPEHATAFFKSHLSPAIVAAIDWSTLVALPASYVQSTLRQTHSDLLFSVKAGERETLLHLLFEHQSTPDPVMPLRLLGYIVEILIRHYETHKRLPLPPVLAFVLHQGPDQWKVSTKFEDLFDLPPELAGILLPFLPKFQHLLLDLSRYDPLAGETEYSQQAILQLMKLARNKKILTYARWLAKTFAGQLSDGLLKRLLLYALHTDSEGEIDVEKIYRSFSTNPELEPQAMTFAEQLRAQGRQEAMAIAEQREARGRREAINEGIEKGQWLGKILTLQQLLGKPQSPAEALGALPQEELEALHQSLHREVEVRFKHP